MPYIETKTNQKISPAQEKELKERLGKAIEIIPGKSEAWLMLHFQDECKLYFKGDNSVPMAFVEVKSLGSANAAVYNRMTGAICEIFESVLGISPAQIYVQYGEYSNWGWNGSNF